MPPAPRADKISEGPTRAPVCKDSPRSTMVRLRSRNSPVVEPGVEAEFYNKCGFIDILANHNRESTLRRNNVASVSSSRISSALQRRLPRHPREQAVSGSEERIGICGARNHAAGGVIKPLVGTRITQ